MRWVRTVYAVGAIQTDSYPYTRVHTNTSLLPRMFVGITQCYDIEVNFDIPMEQVAYRQFTRPSPPPREGVAPRG